MQLSREIWTTLKILNWTKQYFAAKGVENPRLDAEVLLCAALKCERVKLYVDFERPLEQAELTQYKDYVRRRAQAEPIAYILGERGFMRESFQVTPATLIPRPETELLSESVLKAVEANNGADAAVKILDIGTGSGAIIVSLLAYLPQALGVGTDISSAALAVAAANAEKIGVRSRCAFLASDLFERLPVEKKFDVIVSNPPYIATGELASLPLDVQQEPHSALDGGLDGLDFYRRLIPLAPQHMEDDGLLALEIGHKQAETVQELCCQAGLTQTVLRRDYAGLERMVFATREGSKYADILLAIAKQSR